ncbi:hypothetical protein LI328DRAFT_29779 [Trichoderma asperelloides]|nr:hypothetical protein LI328DRAFT_29779 [Trichoderma asperelloides]
MRGRATQDASGPAGRPGSRSTSRLRTGSTSGLPRPSLSLRDSRVSQAANWLGMPRYMALHVLLTHLCAVDRIVSCHPIHP